MATSVIIVLMVITSHINVVHPQTAENATRLHNLLENSINPRVAPTYNLSQPVEIFIMPHLRSIVELDTATQTFTVLFCFTVMWRSEFFTWDPNQYGGVSLIYPHPKKVWYPALGVLNTKDPGVGIINPDNIQITNEHTGQMTWYAVDVISVTCVVDITYYPLDTQTCQIILVLWSEQETGTLLSEVDTVITEFYLENEGWELTGSRVSADILGMSIEVIVKRRATTLLLTVLLPIVMLAAVNIVVFIIPCQSGEKISFSVTLLLSFGVFLNFMAAVMPSSSRSISIAVVYLYVLLVQSTLFVVISCVMVKLHHLDDVSNPVPPSLSVWIRRVEMRMSRKPGSKSSCLNRVIPVKPVAVLDGHEVKNLEGLETKRSSKQSKFDTDEKSLKHTLFRCMGDAYRLENGHTDDKLTLTGNGGEANCRPVVEVPGSNPQGEGDVDMTWARVVHALDWFFFRVFCLIYFVSFGFVLAVLICGS